MAPGPLTPLNVRAYPAWADRFAFVCRAISSDRCPGGRAGL